MKTNDLDMIALDIRVLILMVVDFHGTNSVMVLIFQIYLANFLVAVREVEWEIFSHNSLVVAKEALTTEVMIFDMMLP